LSEPEATFEQNAVDLETRVSFPEKSPCAGWSETYFGAEKRAATQDCEVGISDSSIPSLTRHFFLF